MPKHGFLMEMTMDPRLAMVGLSSYQAGIYHITKRCRVPEGWK